MTFIIYLREKMTKEKIIGIALMILSAIGFVVLSLVPVITMTHHQEVIDGITIDELNWTGKTSQYSCSITIPQIQGYATADIADLNTELLATAKEFVENSIPEEIKDKDTQSAPYMYSLDYRVESEINNILSIWFFVETYTGGAHGNRELTIYHIDTKSGKRLRFDDVFITGADKYFEAEIIKQMDEDPGSYFEERQPNVRSANFYFEGDDIVFIFGQYSIAPYATGTPDFRFKRNDIKKWLKKL